MIRWTVIAIPAFLGALLMGCGGQKASGGASTPTSVTITPATASLTSGGSQVFTATVANDSAGAGVTWSLGSSVGSISTSSITSATYVAPTGLAATTTATLTATSRSDTTKSASVTITITATPVSISLTPTTSTLAASATQSFTATVANDSTNAGVTWSLGSGVGSITASTITTATYLAPAGLSAATTATLTATSKADTSKSASATITLTAPSAPASQWVYYNASGNLAYKTMTNSNNNGADGYDQIMDFSTAGYMQGAVAIPTATVQVTISSSGDTTGAQDTTAIQNALNTVAAMTLNTTTGLRGAVLLNPGNYYVNATLQLIASGVVLRGSGSGTSSSSNTILNMVAATTPYPLVQMGNSSALPSYVGSSAAITDVYVPAGATTLDVASATGFAVGTAVMIARLVTQTWIDFMGMNASTAPINQCSGTCSWIAAGNSGLKTDRTITAISGNRITLDAPMSDSIDSVYTGVNGATVQAYTFSGRISQVGIENFRAIAPVPATNLVPPTASYQLVVTNSVLNAWIRNLTAQDTLQSVDIANYSKQVTVNNVAITHTVTQTQSAKFMEFYIESATQILMDTVSDTTNNMFFFSTSSTTQGPNVLRNGTFFGDTTIEPHQRWATGLLVESTTIAGIGSGSSGGINFYNRGSYGTGHGWTIGWGVAWNTMVGTTAVPGTDIFQQPPGSQNWCIGCKGTQAKQAAPGSTIVLPQGAIDSPGTYVFPSSLYQAQLTQRLGHP
ncbi:MAG: hypothetical protein P4L10_06810 [Acidobacteriaceae bacterium]|nr:hypothetical protein [Acidobacteriaceae bacterium]